MKTICFVLLVFFLMLFTMLSHADDYGDPEYTPYFKKCSQVCNWVNLEILFPSGCEPDLSYKYTITRTSTSDIVNDVPNPPTTIIIENHLFGETEEIRPRVYRVIDLNPFEEIWTYQLYDQQENVLNYLSGCKVEYATPNIDCINDYNDNEARTETQYLNDDSEVKGCSTSSTKDTLSLILILTILLTVIFANYFSKKINVKTKPY